MLKLSFNELSMVDSRETIGQYRPLYGSYGKLLRDVLNDCLTEKQRRYLLLYYAKGLSESEIAEMCGVNRSTVSRTVKRAREKLAREIKVELVRRAVSGRKISTEQEADLSEWL